MEENIMQDARITPAPRKLPEIVRILIYAGITLGVNFATSLFYNPIYNAMFQVLLIDGDMSYDAFNVIAWILGSMDTYGVCIIQGILFRRLVFRSKTSAFLPILVTCGLRDVTNIVSNIVGPILLARVSVEQYITMMNIYSYVTVLIVATLGYIIMRCGFYKRTLDTLVKPRAPLADTGYLSDTEEGA